MSVIYAAFILLIAEELGRTSGFSLSVPIAPPDSDGAQRLRARGTSLQNLQQLLPSGPVLAEGRTEEDDSGGVVTYSNNSGVVLNCAAKGDPEPSITWRFLDQNLVREIPGVREILSNGSLVLLPFSASQYRQDVHAGVYQCAVSNPTGTVLGLPATLRPVVTQGVEVMVRDEAVMSGNTAVLTCELPSSLRDLLTVTAWERDRGVHIYPSLHGDGKYHAIKWSGQLLVHNVDASDSHSTFRCVALHSLQHSTTHSNAARIIVNDPRVPSPPRLITQSTQVRASADLPLILPCVAHANPPPAYRWYQKTPNGDRLPVHQQQLPSRLGVGGLVSGASDTSGESGVLVLESASRLLAREVAFVCEATNAAGSSTMEIRVTRSVPAWVRVQPKVAVVDVGGSTEFLCEVGEGDSSTTWTYGHEYSSGGRGPGTATRYTWYKDGRIIAPSSRIVITGGSLRVTGTQRSDAGMYQCFARSDRTTLQDAAELRLGASPPELLYKFISQKMRPGPSASLKCIARGTPTPTLSWTLDGFPLPQSERMLVGQHVTGLGDVVGHVNISSVRVEDGGHYACTATNVASSVTHEAPLSVYGPPHVRPLGSVTAVAGETFRVRCPVAGYPIETITWAKDGRVLPNNRRQEVSISGVLSIRQVSQKEDRGSYTCTAADKQGNTATQTMHLDIVEPPSVAPFSLPDSLVVGSRVAVQCVLDRGDPPVQLTWLHDHRPATDLPGVTVTPLGQFVLALVIEEVKPEHAGNYTCKASGHSSDGVIDATHSSVLLVHVPPAIRPFEFGSVIAGMRARVSCLVALGDPPLTIRWLKDGLPLDTPMVHDIIMTHPDDYTSSIVLAAVEPRHAGNYTCLARNPARETSYTAVLDVQEPPRWVQPPDQVSVVKGEVAVLQCLAQGFPTPTISWTKNTKGNRLGSNSHSNRLSLPNLPNLAFHSTHLSLFTSRSRGHQMQYRSSATDFLPHGALVLGFRNNDVHHATFLGGSGNVNLQGSSRGTHNNVHPGTRTRPSESQEVVGMDFHRAMMGSRRLTTDGSMNIPGAMSFPNGTLVIQAVTELAEGSYICEATNGVGADISEEVTLTVHAPPTLTGKDRIEARRGDAVTIKCSAEGDPPLSLVLTPPGQVDHRYEKFSGPKHGTEFPRGSSSDDKQVQEIVLREAQPLDSGYFICHASNPYGQDTRRIQLLVQDVPSSPRDLRVMKEDSRSARVTWAAPVSPNTPIASYNVQFREAFGGNSWSGSDVRQVTADGAATSVHLTDLLPATEYQVRVIAVNSVGMSPPSEPLSLRTGGEAPSGAPRNLRATPFTSRSVRVAWTPPPRDTWHGALLGYYVGFKKAGSTDNYVFRTASLPLATSTSNKISSDKSSGHSSYLNDLTDKQDRSKNAFLSNGLDLIAKEVSRGSYSVRNVDDLGRKSHGVSDDDVLQEWVVDELGKYSEYEFIVQAYNAIGPGPLSDPITAITLEDVPEAPPQKVSCSALSPTSLQVSWSPPPAPLTHGQISSYTLTFAPLDDHTGLPASESMSVQSTSATLTELHRYTNYSVRVAAATRAGLGAASSDILCVTDMDVPQAPAKVKAVVSGPTSVRVAWSHPPRTHGPLTHYTVHYRTGTNSESKTLQFNSLNAEITGLREGRQIEVWVTAATRAGDGPASAKIKITPSDTVGAGIYAVGGPVKVGRGTDILLPCPHVGAPKPIISWETQTEGGHNRSEQQPDHSLLIRDCQRADSGNYTCHASNSHGSDHVTYKLLVLVPPSALHLRALSSTSHSVSLQFGTSSEDSSQGGMTTKPYDDGGAPLRRLLLTWRRQGGEWREEELDRHLTQYKLEGLDCGTAHHLYVTPYNAIGAGAASEVATLRTKGSRPPVPPQHRLIGFVNTTSVQLHLPLFSDPDCPTDTIAVKIRRLQPTQGSWRNVGVTAPGSHESVGAPTTAVTVGELAPGSRYEMIVTARNSAGVTEAEYAFTTHSHEERELQGGVLRVGTKAVHSSADLFRDPAFIAPVVVSCLAIVAIVAALVLCWRKKPSEDSNASQCIENKPCELSVKKEEQFYSALRKPPVSPATRTDNTDSSIPEYAEDIYPYATFQEARGTEDQEASSFQTFVFRDPRVMPPHAVSASHQQEYRKGSELAPQYGAVVRRPRARSSSGGYSIEGDLLSEDDLSVSDSDTELPASSRTESSSHLDDASVGGSRRNTHHNLLYVASDASTITSPGHERRSLPRRTQSRMSGSSGGGYGAATVMVKNARNAKANRAANANAVAISGPPQADRKISGGLSFKGKDNNKNSHDRSKQTQNDNVWRLNEMEKISSLQSPVQMQNLKQQQKQEQILHQQQPPNHFIPITDQRSSYQLQEQHKHHQMQQQLVHYPYHQGQQANLVDQSPAQHFRTNNMSNAAQSPKRSKSQVLSHKNPSDKITPNSNGLIVSNNEELLEVSAGGAERKEDERTRARQPTPTPHMKGAEGVSEAECARDAAVGRKVRQRGRNYSIAV
ncbi:Down syndrome cell adhesion molecule-like protein Dscam2 [Hyalella azteca]|uniref:Down syndrome cell adhesion molecule-like protein Dscam2 n=1 Tax=Hyalella azteca TaxID=294128 RepID=A0A979FV07_HYAAZ|nr:Down syndrome cell adhesion molecule-like protein Dscam2 [Hyalella azteca]